MTSDAAGAGAGAAPTGAGATGAPERWLWKEALAPYARPRLGRSVLDLATSVVPYLTLWVLMYLALEVSTLLALGLAVPAAGFLLRTYIVFHDCAHGSFLASKRADAWLGRALGLLVCSPYLSWRHSHAVHHATAGDLDRRGVGDVPTLTVEEYRASSWLRRLGYRLFRNPFVMFGLGPVYALVLQPRLVSRSARRRIRRSAMATNVALALVVGGLCWLVGWRDFLIVEMPAALLAGSAGVWLFYVQHQFEDTYWETADEWSYANAALRGSSYLKLPRVLQFFEDQHSPHGLLLFHAGAGTTLAPPPCRTPPGQSTGARQAQPGTRIQPRFRCHLFSFDTSPVVRLRSPS
jgi:acyl-lipid omega-6 desaturase (Delta-12 desaturase)